MKRIPHPGAAGSRTPTDPATKRRAIKAILGFAAAAAGWKSGWAQDSEELMGYAPRGQVPPGYPAAYQAVVRAAEDEGRLVIYAATDAAVAAPLLADFRSMYPRIQISYEDLNTTELYHRFIAENQMRGESADILWSSAMDQQASLVSSGYAAHYESPERGALPGWANWKDEAFATTYEPVVLAYSKTAFAEGDRLRTHADFAAAINANPARFQGKVVCYDIEKSGVGFLLATQDAQAAPDDFWNTARALGKAATRFELTTSSMAQRLASGQALLGYNLLGGYTLAQARKTPSLGYFFPADYTLVISRIMLISAKAPHPNAARLWADYLLSQRGQTVLADRAGLMALRSDVKGANTASRLTEQLQRSARPIVAGPSLIGYLNNQNYRDFILQWRQAIGRTR